MTPSVLAAADRTCSMAWSVWQRAARDVLRLVQGQLAQPCLDRLQGHVHGQQLADVVFGQQQDMVQLQDERR